MRVAIDFETDAIQPRPLYPPTPIGVGIYPEGGAPHYVDGSITQITRALKPYWHDDKIQLLFHNSKFDVCVAEEKLGLKRPPWHRIDDTLFLAFLFYPYNRTLSLKPLSQKYLDEPPSERDELQDWIVANIPSAHRAPKRWYAHLREASTNPEGRALIKRYCMGDVVRTMGLFKFFYPYIKNGGMLPAYDRERRLMGHLMDMEKRGVRVNPRSLKKDIATYAKVLEQADEQLGKRLKTPGLEVDKNADLAAALLRSKAVDALPLTDKGAPSTAYPALKALVKDKVLLELLGYRSLLATSLRTFMMPWNETAHLGSGGLIYTNWNQVRQDHSSSKGSGTKTGRLSSNPNFQNLISVKDESPRPEGYPSLPQIRGYIIPPKGGGIISCDYNQQEFRVLAHYEDAQLKDAYTADPDMDVHETARAMINTLLGTAFARRPVKNIGFGLLYGMGKDKLAAAVGANVETALNLKRAYLAALPGVKSLMDGIKEKVIAQEPIFTWGGRQYYCEPPDNNGRTFGYRLLNTLIQGSSADITKQAIIDYCESKNVQSRGDELVLTVHDELVATIREGAKNSAAVGIALMIKAMSEIPLDVKLTVEGAWSKISWADTKRKAV